MGSNAAYCFCRFSNFKYEQEEYDKAIHFAKLAKKAGDESGEVYFLLGFYELFLNGDDPIQYFREAIKRDRKILTGLYIILTLINFRELLMN